MMRVVAISLLCIGSASESREHPIEKVITLLQDLDAKVESEGKAEAISFMKFQHWCKNSVSTLEKAIAVEKETIDALKNTIEAKTKEEVALDEQIGKLGVQIGKLDAAASAAQTDRDEANALYVKSRDDLNATINAVGECIIALEDAKDDTSLLVAHSEVKKTIALLEIATTDERVAALRNITADGDANKHVKKYEFKSGDIVELLKQLKLKFEDDLVDIEKAETNAQNGHALSGKARANAKKAAEDSKDEKTILLGETKDKKAEAEESLTSTQDDLTSDSNTLSDTQKTCGVKASEWEERSQIRANERDAMAAAIKILSKVGGVRTGAPSNPVPPPSPLAAESFVQVQASPEKMKAVVFLRNEAHLLKMKALERLAAEISAHLSGPFDEVNGMIEKMIFRLMAEQKDEDDHKNWCDLELNKTQASLDNKDEKLEKMSAKLRELTADVNKLTEDISEANGMISEITGFMKEAAEIREVGKQENAKAMKDAQDAQTAISNAIAVLTDFYKSSGQIEKEAWEFVQEPAELPEQPESWDSGYTGVSDAQEQPGGIVSVLKATSEDFASMEADTRAQEAQDQEAFDADMQANQIEKAKRSKEVEMKTNEKKRLVNKIDETTKTKQHVNDEREATEEYQKNLQPACVDGDSSYEDRKSARSKEIEALHNAQNILADAFKAKPAENEEEEATGDAFLQKRKVHRH